MAAKSSKRPPAKVISAKKLIHKLRKPLAPPMQIAEDERKYKRARELERLRRKSQES
ncbi:MAG: hypothetical protein ACREQT_00940 [Candidatus Binataceae bacterium]